MMEKLLGVSAIEFENDPPFGKQTFFFTEMLEAASDLAIDVFFFSPIHWKESSAKINGYVYTNTKWKRAKCNLPQIIYDRTFSKNEFETQKINQFRSYLNTHKINVLNPIKMPNPHDGYLLLLQMISKMILKNILSLNCKGRTQHLLRCYTP
jgi:hypothetical protein